MLQWFTLIGAALAGCGSDPAPLDAGDCWPMSSSTPGGTIELGTGDSAFVAMPTEITLVYGSQGGYHIPTRARIRGMQPGDLLDITSPTNPRTRIRGFFSDSGDATYGEACPLRVGYQGQTDGSFVEPNVIESRFFESLAPGDLEGKQVRVRAEVIDSNNLYASDEKVITVHVPPQ
ncbi:MAG TPA: hypothetical protein VGC41_09565 [Kofleriaceae bacterium]